MPRGEHLKSIMPDEIEIARKAGLCTLEEARTKYILYVLRYTNGNVRRAARILGCSRNTINLHLSKKEKIDDQGTPLS